MEVKSRDGREIDERVRDEIAGVEDVPFVWLTSGSFVELH